LLTVFCQFATPGKCRLVRPAPRRGYYTEKCIVARCVCVSGNSSRVILQVWLHSRRLLRRTTCQVQFQEVNASVCAQLSIHRPRPRLPACCRAVRMAAATAVYTADRWHRGRLAGYTGLFSDGLPRRRMGLHLTGNYCYNVLCQFFSVTLWVISVLWTTDVFVFAEKKIN